MASEWGSCSTRSGRQVSPVIGLSSSSCHSECSSGRYQLLILVFRDQKAVSIMVTARKAPDASNAPLIIFPGKLIKGAFDASSALRADHDGHRLLVSED